MDCICEGNWRAIVSEHQEYFGKRVFNRAKPELGIATYMGVLWADDDFYHHVIWDNPGPSNYFSCVGDLFSTWNFGLDNEERQ